MTDLEKTILVHVNKSILHLELSVRSYNCLVAVGIRTIGEIAAVSDRELLRVPNFGKVSFKELRLVVPYQPDRMDFVRVLAWFYNEDWS